MFLKQNLPDREIKFINKNWNKTMKLLQWHYSVVFLKTTWIQKVNVALGAEIQAQKHATSFTVGLAKRSNLSTTSHSNVPRTFVFITSSLHLPFTGKKDISDKVHFCCSSFFCGISLRNLNCHFFTLIPFEYSTNTESDITWELSDRRQSSRQNYAHFLKENIIARPRN